MQAITGGPAASGTPDGLRDAGRYSVLCGKQSESLHDALAGDRSEIGTSSIGCQVIKMSGFACADGVRGAHEFVEESVGSAWSLVASS